MSSVMGTSSSSSYGSDPHYCDRSAATTVYIVISAVLFAAVTILLPLRIYVRLYIVHAFWWDDVLLLISYALTVPWVVLLWITVGFGLGRHMECVSEDTYTKGLEYYFIAELLDIFSNIFARCAAALLVVRLFAITRKLKFALYGWTIFMAMAVTTCGFLVLFTCRPIQALWEPSLRPEAKCWSDTMANFYQYFNGVVAALSDYILALLPIYFIRSLHVSRMVRWRIGFVLALGLIPGTCAIVRSILTQDQRSNDVLYSTVLLALFAAIEQLMLLICPSIAGLAPLFSTKKKNPRRLSAQWKVEWSPLRTIRNSEASESVTITRSWHVSHEGSDVTSGEEEDMEKASDDV